MLYKVLQTIAGRPTVVQRLQGHMWPYVKKTLCKLGFNLSGKGRCAVRKTSGTARPTALRYIPEDMNPEPHL